jgi:hypothetical protein
MAISKGFRDCGATDGRNAQVVCRVRDHVDCIQSRFVRLFEAAPMIMKHLTSAFLGSMLFLVLLTVFDTFTPVTTFMQVREWRSDRSSITADVVGFKIRDCDVVPGSSVGWVKGSEWYEVPFEFVDDDTPDSSKPATSAKQSFGLWRWVTRPVDGKLVKMTIQHKCDGVVRTTTAGPFGYVVNR